jgi:hypothetical protein
MTFYDQRNKDKVGRKWETEGQIHCCLLVLGIELRAPHLHTRALPLSSISIPQHSQRTEKNAIQLELHTQQGHPPQRSRDKYLRCGRQLGMAES